MDVVREYLLLGLRFDRLVEGFVDSYTGDPALRRQVDNEPVPDPAALARRAGELRAELSSSDLSEPRAQFLSAHLTALECSGRVIPTLTARRIARSTSYCRVAIR